MKPTSLEISNKEGKVQFSTGMYGCTFAFWAGQRQAPTPLLLSLF